MDDLKERSKDLHELAQTAKFYTQTRPLIYDEKATQILADADKTILDNLIECLEHLDPFDTENIDALCKRQAEENDIKLKDIMLRLMIKNY